MHQPDGALHQKVNTTRLLLFHQLIQRQSSQKLVLLNPNMNVSLIMGRLSFGLRRLKPSQEQVGLKSPQKLVTVLLPFVMPIPLKN